MPLLNCYFLFGKRDNLIFATSERSNTIRTTHQILSNVNVGKVNAEDDVVRTVIVVNTDLYTYLIEVCVVNKRRNGRDVTHQ